MLGAFLLSTLGLAPGVGADGSLWVAPPQVDGRTTIDVAGRITAELDQVDGLAIAGQVEAPSSCDATCVAGVAADAGIDYVAESELKIIDDDYEFEIVVRDMDTGAVLANASELCEVCNVAEAEQMLSRATRRLREPLGQLRSQPARVLIEGAPDDATVSVDGVEVGPAPYHGVISPGAHQFAVSRPAYTSTAGSWVAVAGETTVLPFTLTPWEPPPKSLTRFRPLGWTLVAVGSGAIVTGVALMASHAIPVQSSCPGGMPDDAGRCPKMLRTLGIGAAASGGGVALAGAGAVVLVAARKTAVSASLGEVTVLF